MIMRQFRNTSSWNLNYKIAANWIRFLALKFKAAEHWFILSKREIVGSSEIYRRSARRNAAKHFQCRTIWVDRRSYQTGSESVVDRPKRFRRSLARNIERTKNLEKNIWKKFAPSVWLLLNAAVFAMVIECGEFSSRSNCLFPF